MRRLVLLAFLGSAGAAPVDCATLNVASTWDLTYRTVEQFPNPVDTVRVDLYTLKKPYTFADCRVTVKADAKTLSIRANSIKGLSQVMGGGSGWTLPLFGVVRRNGKPAYIDAGKVRIDLPGGLSGNVVGISGYFTGTYLPADAVIAVRVNGGALKPLLYNGSFRTVTLDPKLDTLELLVRSRKPLVWQRLKLDARTSTMTLDKTYPFPAR